MIEKKFETRAHSDAILNGESLYMRVSQRSIARLLAVLAASLVSIVSFASDSHTSSKFSGPKVNAGTVTHTTQNGKSVLTLSDDFVVPDTPDPHWQVVDSDGNVYELDKLKVKSLIGDKYQKEI